MSKLHTPRGVSLRRFEELDPLCLCVPDWMRYSEQQFSGYLRELSDDTELSAGEYLQELRQACSDAAERLDQAHLEWLEQLKKPKARLSRCNVTERALSWAHQQSYACSRAALDVYCDDRGLTWSDDPMYSYVTFTEAS